MNTNPKTGVVLVLSAAALWGTTGTAQSFAGGALSPLWFGALRLLVAALFFAVCFALQRRAAAAGPRAPLPPLALLGAGLSMAAYNLSFFGGVRLAGVAVGTAIALGSAPVWAGVLQALITRQAPGARWWLGTALAVGGGVLLALSGGSAAGAVQPLGVALCLLAGLSYAVYTLASQRLLRVAPPAAVTLYAFGAAAALALPAAWWQSGGLPQVHLADAAAALYVGVAATGVAYLLYGHALRHIATAPAVTLALAEPVVAFLLAVAVVGERPSGYAVLGLLLVVAGVLAVVRNELAGASRRAAQGQATAPAGPAADAASSRQLHTAGS